MTRQELVSAATSYKERYLVSPEEKAVVKELVEAGKWVIEKYEKTAGYYKDERVVDRAAYDQ